MSRSPLKHPLWLVAVAAVLGLIALQGWKPAVHLSGGPVVATLVDGRAGKMRFASHDANWREFRSGRFTDNAVTIAGELIMPRRGAATVPAAVLLHGSDGLTDHQYRYAAALAEWGIAAFVVDSFEARGVKNTIGNQGAVTPYSMLLDAYAALALLATHPSIDPNRIALVGWSKGGMAADWAARRRIRDRIADHDRGFAAHVAFYPWCGEQEARIELTGAPILYLLGELDDWVGAQTCVDYANRARDAGYRTEAIVYPNAHHGFDYAGRSQTYLAEAESWAGCAYFVRSDGFVIAETGRFERWSRLNRYLQQCTKKGAHVATTAAARERAVADLRRFLKRALAD